MNCSQCGSPLTPGAASCPQCGTPAPAPAGGMPQPAPMAATGGPGGMSLQGFNFDFARLTQADKITGIASLVLLISLFLPWYSWSVRFAGVQEGGSFNGMVHGYLWLTFLLCLAIAGFLALSAGFDQLPFQLPLAREMLLLIATGVNLLLVLIAFFLTPGALLVGSGVGWSFGAFIALLAAIAACAPLAVPVIKGSMSSTGS